MLLVPRSIDVVQINPRTEITNLSALKNMDQNALPLHHNHNITSTPPPPPPPPPPLPLRHYHKPSFLHFYWGKNAEILFSGWPDNHLGMYALALVFVFVLAVLVEFLSNLNLVKPGSNRVARVFFQTGFHGIRAGFAYMVVLAVMSFNGGVFIAAVLGHAIGYLIFGSRTSKKDSG
ncbi:copper transporter 4-like [Olea europaea subsp. europaea]|uniref:Copper transport protein n=1 Tax=Olea europaea subsp. europaea TaxID=158383 RepID=A0A8S0QZF3_OLEEU|nr:copper transporter 4-like [Olea europaea subsp. europaea]